MDAVSPVQGYVSSRYGRRGSGNHLGLDIATNKKPGPVYAMFDGVFERIVRGRGHGDTSRKNELAAFRTGDGPMIRNSDGERQRSEEHTSELQSLIRISSAVFCLEQKNQT